MKKLRVLALMHPDFVPPEKLDGLTPAEVDWWKTEYDVVTTLRALGHEVRVLGVQYDVTPIREAAAGFEPHVVFNLLEEFHGQALLDHGVVSYLELLQLRYTGCNARGLMIARGKALSKKLLAYHRIRVPAFAVFPRGRAVRRPEKLQFPLIVKSLVEHASLGIALASVVDSDERLGERVAFVHERIGTDAIAEQFIEGREVYVGVIGNERVQVLPTWELCFDNMPPNVPLIATARVKHDPEYAERRGIRHQAADLPGDLQRRTMRLCRRIYRLLELDGYARIDFRLTPSGELYFLEANPNPEIAEREEFAQAALHAGLSYPALLQRILQLGLRRGQPER